MKIGFIGAGAVAQSIARSAIQAGHEVVLSARRGPQALGDIMAALGPNASADTVQEVAGLDLVVLAIPWLQVPSALDGLPNWAGRILVDTTNPFTQYEPRLILADLGDKGASEIVAAHAPAATTGSSHRINGLGTKARLGELICTRLKREDLQNSCRCSARIAQPMPMSTTPPASSARRPTT
ncbi:NADPH-dependent F420 reductase [Paraburkholderia kirstenboschensis]|uniref:NAD(P)-binding domain-containing protein n=1 Tax=Paraburkholderia kirstenboschensis TaxID=1245436 RepID=A0ABZ0E903_9BURK|nr:NAD(P)-binding domain-containing protein [Paraburkholderia kirstenboschensis]WOD13720.1 NAD(P)-binding domain-containing protein [Paraburkholderia kirstenboschensis]